MSRIKTELVTRHYPTKWLRQNVGNDTTIDLSGVGAQSGLTWDNRTFHNTFSLEKLWGGNVPNGLIVDCYAASAPTPTINSTFKFAIGCYRDIYNTYQRIADVVAVIGGMRLSQHIGTNPIGGTATTGRFVDTMTETDYWDGVETMDAGGNNGRSQLRFDLRGVKYICINNTSAAGENINYAITGW